jgi:hypothetical protein
MLLQRLVTLTCEQRDPSVATACDDEGPLLYCDPLTSCGVGFLLLCRLLFRVSLPPPAASRSAAKRPSSMAPTHRLMQAAATPYVGGHASNILATAVVPPAVVLFARNKQPAAVTLAPIQLAEAQAETCSVFTETVEAHESTPTNAFHATIDETFFLRKSTLAEITVCRRIDKVAVLHNSPLTSHGVKPKTGQVMKPINLGGFRIDLDPRLAVREPLFHILCSHLVAFHCCWYSFDR